MYKTESTCSDLDKFPRRVHGASTSVREDLQTNLTLFMPMQWAHESDSSPARWGGGGSHLWCAHFTSVVKLLPLGLQVFLEWLLQRWTYAGDSTGGRDNTPRTKVHLGRKEGKMLRKNPLTAWIQKAGIGRKKKKVELSAELVKSWELFFVDKNPSCNNPIKEKNLSRQHVCERVGAQLLASRRRVHPQSEASSAEAVHWCGTKNQMNDFWEVPHLSPPVPVRTGLNRLIRKWLMLVSFLVEKETAHPLSDLSHLLRGGGTFSL